MTEKSVYSCPSYGTDKCKASVSAQEQRLRTIETETGVTAAAARDSVISTRQELIERRIAFGMSEVSSEGYLALLAGFAIAANRAYAENLVTGNIVCTEQSLILNKCSARISD